MADNMSAETQETTLEQSIGPNIVIATGTPRIPLLSEDNLPTITTEAEMERFLIDVCKVRYQPSTISEGQLPLISNERLQNLGLAENKIKMLQKSLGVLKGFLLTPVITDGWKDDYEARIKSIKLLEKKYGTLFEEAFYSRNKLRINMLTEASGHIKMLAYIVRGNATAPSLSDELDHISKDLKDKLEGTDTEEKPYEQIEPSVPYIEWPLSKKLKMAAVADAKVIQALNLLAGTSKEKVEERELVAV